MAIHRTIHNKNDSITVTRHMATIKMSGLAKAIWMYALSFNGTWAFNMAHICICFTDSRECIKRAIKELEHYGFLQRHKRQSPDGKFFWEWDFYEISNNSSIDGLQMMGNKKRHSTQRNSNNFTIDGPKKKTAKPERKSPVNEAQSPREAEDFQIILPSTDSPSTVEPSVYKAFLNTNSIHKETTNKQRDEKAPEKDVVDVFLDNLPDRPESKASFKRRFKRDALKRAEIFYNAKIGSTPTFTPNNGWCAYLASAIANNWALPSKPIASTQKQQANPNAIMDQQFEETIENNKRDSLKLMKDLKTTLLDKNIWFSVYDDRLEFRDKNKDIHNNYFFHSPFFKKEVGQRLGWLKETGVLKI